MTLSLSELMQLTEEYIAYLASRDIEFDENGYPVLTEDYYLTEAPDDLVTYSNRNSCFVKDKSKTVLCFFCSDKLIYPRLKQVLNDLPEYKKFLGVVAPDITVTTDMDIEWQREILLINQLFIAVLAVNGIKIVANLRSGTYKTWDAFKALPHGVICATGTLGCQQSNSPMDLRFIKKVLQIRPRLVLLYGKEDPVLEKQLQTFGIPYNRFDDIHTRYNKRRRTQLAS